MPNSTDVFESVSHSFLSVGGVPLGTCVCSILNGTLWPWLFSLTQLVRKDLLPVPHYLPALNPISSKQASSSAKVCVHVKSEEDRNLIDAFASLNTSPKENAADACKSERGKVSPQLNSPNSLHTGKQLLPPTPKPNAPRRLADIHSKVASSTVCSNQSNGNRYRTSRRLQANRNSENFKVPLISSRRSVHRSPKEALHSKPLNMGTGNIPSDQDSNAELLQLLGLTPRKTANSQPSQFNSVNCSKKGKTTYPNASSDIYPLSSSSVSINEQPLISWNPTQVAHWLAVVGLGRFVALFLKLNLDGSFLSKVTPDSPYLSQVIDPFAREALKQAILVLQGQNPAPGEDVSIFTKLERKKISLDKPEIIGKHDFQLTSFYRVVSCIVCNVPLLGFAHQGFQCKACGAICHRICKALDGFSDCLGNFTVLQSSVHEELSTSCESTEIPTSLVPYISDYFGVKLEDQKLDSTSKLPIFLAACTEQIEKLANESFITASNNPHTQPIDMVMVYQQSALAHTLQELHNTFAHCLPLPDSEQSSVLPLDIVRLAQLMKAFLRDLPVAVIPEEYYLDFCHLANITNTDEKILAVRKFLDNLPEIHRLCLIHIFNHLGFVVNHQNKLRSYLSNLSPINITQSNSLNAPSKLTLWLMVFRQILVRPPWHLITDIAMGMDTHMRALEAVFGVVVGSCVTDESENTSHIESSLSIPFVSEPNPDMNTSIARRKCDPQSSSDKHKSSELVAPCRTDAIVVPTIVTPPSPSSTAVNKKDLENQEWYWGDITQEEVREIMTGLQDGYYLVRDASQRSVAAFTLVVRWHGENKLNRIYHRGDYFGFTDPPQPTFRLVSELINFCRAHPLTVSSYSSLRLIWPVSRRHKRFNDKIDASSDSNVSAENRCSSGVFACFLSDSQLSSELKNIVVKITQLDKLITDLELQSKNAVDLKEEAFRLMKAYTNLHKWLQTSLSRLNDYSCPSEKSKISPQIETLNDEMNKAEQQIKTNKEERKLKRQAQEIRRALKDRGFNEESLSSSTSSLIDGSIPSVSSSVDTQNTSVPEEIRDRRYWFLTGVTREKVEALLADRPPGTFVIRPSTAGNKLALGVRLESSVQHCLIHCIEGKYGFVEKSCTYDSLEALAKTTQSEVLGSPQFLILHDMCFGFLSAAARTTNSECLFGYNRPLVPEVSIDLKEDF
ncbi:unnamed protein product [Heterobilharzia americana]|nr:unnamed protein product [Heterobilharzia americana]